MNDWIKEAIFYQIYPLGFCGAPRMHQTDITHSIKKITEWIPHLKEMHVNAVYIGPVFESYEHGYDTSDYQMLDRRLGTNEDFKEVCHALHKANIRIILDGVFNHVGRYFWAFLDVQKNLQNSPYCSWFHNLNFSYQSPMQDPFTYDAWEGHYNLIKLNLQNEDVVQYFLASVQMWMDEFGIDGLRLDAADCIDPAFFHHLRTFCKSKKDDFWLMGEIIHGDYTMWANDKMLDSVTNYECFKGLYSSHNTKNYFEIAYSINRQFGKDGIYKHLTLYNFVDNHDVNRLASTLEDARDIFNVYTLLYTMPGIPSIYYGSEWAIKGIKQDGNDAAIRPCITLQDMDKQNTALFAYICKLGAIKEHYTVLSYGDYTPIIVHNEQFVFKRTYQKETLYIAMNLSHAPYTCSFDVASLGVRDCLTKTKTAVDHHVCTLTMKPKSVYILEPIDTLVNEDQQVNDIAKQEVNIQQSRRNEIVPGRYQHFKGKSYAVLYIASHSETMERFVVYRQLYGTGDVWVRPLQMFQEYVEFNGQQVPRFQYIGK